MTVFGLPELQASAAVLVCIIVVLILTGRLVPRRTVEDLRADRDARVAAAQEQAETWRRAYELAVQSRRMADQHVDELLEAARTTRDVLTALPTVPRSEVEADATHKA